MSLTFKCLICICSFPGIFVVVGIHQLFSLLKSLIKTLIYEEKGLAGIDVGA